MTDPRAAIDSYLALRRSLGYQLTDAGWLLPDFIDYLHRHGAEQVSTELALEWATQPVNTSPVWWRQRLNVVRGFAQYLRTIDPDTDVPPRDLLPAHQQRVTPYLYSETDLAALMAAARSLIPPLRAATYETFIGLLSVTGLRLGEGLALDRDDVDRDHQVLRVRHAKRGGRLVPVHETTIRALQDYTERVDRYFPNARDPGIVRLDPRHPNEQGLRACHISPADRPGGAERSRATTPAENS